MDKSKIDELRGLACLLVLAFHAIGSEPSLKHDVFGYLAASLAFVRMPVFISITGLLYGLSRGSTPLTLHGWQKRMARLFPPFVAVSGFICGLQVVQGYGFHPVYAAIYGAWHLWYILALGVILLAVVAIEALIPLTSGKLWLVAGCASLVAAGGAFNNTAEFAISRAVALAPFFFAGAAIGSTPKQELAKPLKTMIYAAGFTSLILHQLSLAGIGYHWSRGSLVATSLGLAGFLFLGAICPASRRLRQIGVHSLPIFLWHLPIYAVASGLILHRVAPEPHVAVLIRIAVGISFAIILATLVEVYAPGLSIWVGARTAKRRTLDLRRENERRIEAMLPPEPMDAAYDTAEARH